MPIWDPVSEYQPVYVIRGQVVSSALNCQERGCGRAIFIKVWWQDATLFIYFSFFFL
jgi:hypothetical protein